MTMKDRGSFDPTKLPKGKFKIKWEWLNKPEGAFWTSL